MLNFHPILLDGNVELANTLQRQLVFLHVDAHRVSHKLPGEILTLWHHGGKEETHLNIPAQRFEDVVDLILEATRQHLVGLITDKGEQVVHAQVALAQHVEHAAWRTDHDVLSAPTHVEVVAHRRFPGPRPVPTPPWEAAGPILASARGSALDTTSKCSRFVAEIR